MDNQTLPSKPVIFSKYKENIRFKTTLILSAFMAGCIMLVMTGIMLKINHLNQEETRKALRQQIQFLYALMPEYNEQMLKHWKNDSVVFLPKDNLSTTFKQSLGINSPVFLSKKKIRQLQWNSFGFEGSAFVTRLAFSERDWIIGMPVPKYHLNYLFIYSGLYLIVAITIVLLVNTFFTQLKMQRRLYYIRSTAEEILKGNLNKRIPINPLYKDEYSEVSKVLNSVLDKNTQLMHDLKQVNNNIAHDLKSPLSRMRSRMEISLLKSKTVEEYQQILSQSIDDVDTLLKTFQSLLLMGNLDSGARNYQLERTSLSSIIQNLSELYELVAEDNGHSFESTIETDIFTVANSSLLAQAVSNLLENAIKYTPSGGHIRLGLRKNSVGGIIQISDNGPGIPKEKQELVFDRFVRLDDSRQKPGTGLGMSLVRSILNIHKASIQLHDNKPGLCVEIWIRTCE